MGSIYPAVKPDMGPLMTVAKEALGGLKIVEVQQHKLPCKLHLYRTVGLALADARTLDLGDGQFAIIEDEDLNLMNVSPPYGELGREMRQLGLSNNVLHVQVHPTRLLINPEHPLYNPTDVDLHVED